jgi:hypothetical protein
MPVDLVAASGQRKAKTRDAVAPLLPSGVSASRRSISVVKLFVLLRVVGTLLKRFPGAGKVW